MAIIIVCGSRHYTDIAFVYRALDYIAARRVIDMLVEGGQTGADRFAREWAISRGIPHHTEEADWGYYGRAAGPIRNNKMLLDWHVDGVVAFRGDRGTRDMTSKAEAAGVPVYRPDDHRKDIDADTLPAAGA